MIMLNDLNGIMGVHIYLEQKCLVIMPANEHNAGFTHPNVVRYDGTNLAEVRDRMMVRFGTPNTTP